MSRRKFTLESKFKVVLEPLSERFTIQLLGRKYYNYPVQITNCKSPFLKKGGAVSASKAEDIKT